jgi:hypothetical protein
MMVEAATVAQAKSLRPEVIHSKELSYKLFDIYILQGISR